MGTSLVSLLRYFRLDQGGGLTLPSQRAEEEERALFRPESHNWEWIPSKNYFVQVQKGRKLKKHI